ncbi:uncharacterized protein LOC117332076 [Pecten maximus]|uniref:uncharacterized protein LOC117332076 n=1 Tax=Pecten maximus TaxID=6579 RepID=UPI0014585B40|nr:uncharacterized protein LOC117332076 [Pecten maximus]
MLNEYHTCYWAVQNSHAYVNLTACEDTGGYLAVLPSGAVMEKLVKLIEDAGSISTSNYYWIDVNDLDEEGTYINRFGPVSWTAWDSGQPNDDRETEDQDCTIMSPRYSYEWHDRNCLNEAGYYSLCFFYPSGDGYRRRYVIHTDATNTTYGNVTELISDIDRGVAVRVLIQGIPGMFDDLVLQADAIFTYHDGVERRCVQSVHNMVLQSSYLLRIVLFACTTGSLRVETWANGAQTEVSYGVLMTWFTTDYPTLKVLQTSGAPPDASFNLTEAIIAGKDFMVLLGTARYPLHDMYYGTNVTGQFSWVASKTNWTSVMIDYEGYIHKVDWWDSNVHTFNKQSESYAFLMADNWNVVYSNTGDGTIMLLANYISAGHEVKVDIGGRVSTVEMIFMKSYQIHALLSSELVSDTMQTDLKRTVTIVSSSGKIVTYEFGFEQNTYLNEHTTKTTVRWLVDTSSVWTEIYRTDSTDSSSDQGVFTLHDALYNGQPIRLKVDTTGDYSVFFTADFVTRISSSDTYTARYSRGFSFRNLDEGGIAINSPVHHLHIEVTSEGDCQVITIPNGISAVNTSSSVPAKITWYSKPYIF